MKKPKNFISVFLFLLALATVAQNSQAQIANPGIERSQKTNDVKIEIKALPLDFKIGAAELTPASMANLQKQADLLKRLPAGTIVEIGVHTFAVGNEALNVKLTQRRAENVRNALINLNIAAASLTAKGYGSSKPIASNETEEGRAKNKRVEYLVIKSTLGAASKTVPTTTTSEVKKPDTAAATSQMKNGRFLSKDAEIYYEIYGAKMGTPLFVVHGGPGFDHQYFLSNSAFTELGKTRPIVFYDQRGTGKSAKVSGDNAATLKNNVEDLENLRRHLGYEKIDVAGHSFGGLVAMSYAVFFPDSISHLILIDSVPANYDDDYSTFQKDYPKEFGEMRAKRVEAVTNNDPKAMRASVVAYMKMLFYSPQNRDAFIAGSENYTYDAEVNGSVNQSAEGFNITPGIVKLTIPTLILHGRHDANITVNSSELIQQKILKSRLVIFEQSGHMPFYEEKEKFVSTVNDFLK